ncbi:putative bifunctional diguanylate cyclase/phosphodiesterase [Paraglaciecola aestuariivivens]
MLFKTIKNTITSLTAFSILLVCSAVLYFSIQEHENLYRESAKSDLDGLSENMASDLVPFLASTPDSFEISTLLLRLDNYENVKFSVVFNQNWHPIEIYYGNTFAADMTKITQKIASYKKYPPGVFIDQQELIALKLIGDLRLPLGYLLIVNDSQGPLEQSKASLLRQVLPFAILVVLLVIALSVLIQQRLFMPLDQLSKLAQKIRNTQDYSLRIDIKGKKEVADLSQNINLMMDTISQETEKNRAYTQQLKAQQTTMERLANFDALTGLPNRQFFMETLRVELAKAERNGQNLVLMYFDLDGFKSVNDSFGHEAGDQLLIKVCQRAKTFLREGDLISRLGGDEFLILLHNEPNELMLYEIAERLVKGLSKPFEINSWEVQVGISIGIAKADDSNFNLSEFISNADLAMYRSKMIENSTHTVFIPEMMEDNKRKLSIANSIINAIKQDEFSLFYQAKVCPNEKVVSYEALIRWNSQALGFVSPAEFIPIAEQSGKILDVTKWVLQSVCRDFASISELHNNTISVSVNLSAHDIKSPTLVSFIKSLFIEYKIDPTKVEFEVTESAYLENFETANKFLSQLRTMGSTVALDDFGTGYSSLSYLTQINLNTLKIDKQFVDNLNLSKRSTLITKTIIEMAKQLNLQICAEGVETREQAEFLIQNGCHQLQGYLYSKPQSLPDLIKDKTRLLASKQNS